MKVCDRCGKRIETEMHDIIEDFFLKSLIEMLGIKVGYDLCDECVDEIAKYTHEKIKKLEDEIRDFILKKRT